MLLCRIYEFIGYGSLRVYVTGWVPQPKFISGPQT